MKRIIAILLLATATFAQTAPQPSENENARKARALLDKMIQAMGGQAWLNIQDVTQEGRTYGFSRNGESGGGVQFWRFYKYPDKDRLELTKQRDWVIIYNGDKGYETTFRGTATVDKKTLDEFLERGHYALDRVLREWLHQPGLMLFDDGPAIAERKPTEKVTLLNSKNESVSIFIDNDTFLPVKKSYQHRNPEYRDLDTEEESYDNWHAVQGIQTPYDVVRTHNGQMVNQRFMNKVEYNTGIPDSMFVPKGPVKEAK